MKRRCKISVTRSMISQPLALDINNRIVAKADRSKAFYAALLASRRFFASTKSAEPSVASKV